MRTRVYTIFSLFIAVFLNCCFPLYAQRLMEDVLYLKNGSILRGKFVELNADTIKIEIAGGNLLVYAASEAKAVTKEKAKRTYKQTGYRFAIESGILTGRSPKGNTIGANKGINSFTVQMVNSLQLRPELAIGIGLGLDSYQNYAITPVYLRFSGTLFQRQFSPMYTLDAGYGFYSHIFNKESTSDGGLMINPALGINIRAGTCTAFIISVGYRHQYTRNVISFGVPGEGIIEKSTFKRLSIRAGFIF